MTFRSFLKQGHRLTDREIERAAREMLTYYAQAEKDIQRKMEAIYARYLSGVKPEDYYNILIQHDRLNRLLREIQTTYTFYYGKAGKMIGNAGQLAMSNSYYRQLYSLSWQAPVSFVGLDRRVVEAAVFGMPRIWQGIPKAARDRFTAIHGPIARYIPQYGTLTDLLSRNRVDDIKRIQQAITQGIIQGQSGPQMSRLIRDVVGKSAYNADRIIRTETHRLRAIGDQLAGQDAAEQGVILKKQWMATLDDATRDSHASLDGVMVDPDEEFPGGALYPGGFGDPAEDINCRCVVNTIVVRDDVPVTPQTRRGRDPETGENREFTYRTFGTWAAENNLTRNRYGELYTL